MVPWRTFTIHGTLSLQKSFFMVVKKVLKITKMLKEMVILTKRFFRVLKVVLLWPFWVQNPSFGTFICKTTC